MDVNLGELAEKVNTRLSSLDDEMAKIQNRIKDIENDRAAMRKLFEAIGTVSTLADEFAMKETARATGEPWAKVSRTGFRRDVFESQPGGPLEPERLASNSYTEGKSDETRSGKAEQGDVITYLKEQLDPEAADDAPPAHEIDALSLRI